MEDFWYIYILECVSGKLYTGICKDMSKRFLQHSEGKGAKFFRLEEPLKIIYFEKVNSKSSALKREIEIKRLSRVEKFKLINRIPS